MDAASSMYRIMIGKLLTEIRWG